MGPLGPVPTSFHLIVNKVNKSPFPLRLNFRNSKIKRFLTAGSWGLTPSRHRTSPLSLRAQTGTCSILLWARHGIRETSLSGMGGTCCHGPPSVILHFLWTKHTNHLMMYLNVDKDLQKSYVFFTSSIFCAWQSLLLFCDREMCCKGGKKTQTSNKSFFFKCYIKNTLCFVFLNVTLRISCFFKMLH